MVSSGQGVGHVNRGGGMEFGAVEQAVKSLLVLLAQPLAKFLPSPCSFSRTWLKGMTVRPIFSSSGWFRKSPSAPPGAGLRFNFAVAA